MGQLNSTGIALTGNMTTTGLIDANTADLRVVLSNSNKAMVVSSDYSFQSSASTIFEVKSTTKGFLPPRMTTTQKNAIASPAAGLVVYDTTLNKLCVYTTAWETITSV
jgi:mannose/fructose/N-acetylgalactosamine-specific phosphotransferase system component IIC